METEKKTRNSEFSKRKNNYIPLSASVIASLLFALNPNQKVSAEDIEEDNQLSDLKSVYEEYHTLLTIISESEDDQEESTEQETNEELIDNDEFDFIKENLLQAIKNAGSPEIVEQIENKQLTVEEIDQIFEDLVAYLVEQDETANSQPEDIEAEEVTDSDIPSSPENDRVEENLEDDC